MQQRRWKLDLSRPAGALRPTTLGLAAALLLCTRVAAEPPVFLFDDMETAALPGNSTAGDAFEFGGEIFFTTSNGFWKSDGVSAEFLKQLDADLSFAVVFGGAFYFSADDGTTGLELWRCDGTAAGTQLVKDLIPGAAGSVPGDLAVMGGELFFAARDATTGRELWKSDGTELGTVRVKDIRPGISGSNPIGFEVLGAKLYVIADDGNFKGLFESDGTDAGTLPVTTGVKGGSEMVRAGALLFYPGNLSGASGSELVASDGTPAGTVVIDIDPASTASPALLTAVGTKVFFRANGPSQILDLFVSDGTPAGTQHLSSLAPSSLGVDLGGLYLVGTSAGLLRSDGTVPGTSIVTPVPFTVLNPTVVGAQLFFTGDDGVHGDELWVSDGTDPGTLLVKDIQPGAVSSVPLGLRSRGGVLYFSATDPVDGRELMVSDGSEAGTGTFVNLAPDVGSSTPALRFQLDGEWLIEASVEPYGTSLWVTDTQTRDTQFVADLDPTAGLVCCTSFWSVGTVALFRGSSEPPGGEALWRTDGTPGGTTLVDGPFAPGGGPHNGFDLPGGSSTLR